MGLGIQGDVRLAFVIAADGSVDDVRVVRSLHPDLDEAAVAAVRKSVFRPAVKNGVPVPVVATMDVSFEKLSMRRFCLCT